ncbi:hypothetical protein CONLIGDRAFT_598861 [Coniochaeta ligniaria NRRL 30616]|uniref:3-hydroxyisobutyrate dehydrogenase n=1 Tax=Coniochaeta ligniaria NRRL 30616 TaxID=1408157 RepID=A0A1J7J6Y0_9PEZI|nr:hypothetical protein CONLIGDRAFT_598861 [Coniochaeta ligniaria NRRL 30616]
MTQTDTSALPNSVGFIGLGLMGKPMVVNLAKKLPPGARIHVHDVVTAVVDELCASYPDRIIRCTSAREVTEKSDVILTMLPEGSHVKSVYLDPTTGILPGLLSSPSESQTGGKLVIDSSTIDTATSQHVSSLLASSSPSTTFYDAPVSGGVLGAVNGTIAFFLGASRHDANLPRLLPLLDLMGGKTIPCGGPTLGLAAKLSNNYLSGIITIATSEAMDMGMRAGIDADVLASVFAAGTAQNAICDTFNPVPRVCPAAPSSHGYVGGFRVQLMRKDMGLAVDMARRVGSRNVLGAGGLGVYAAASEAADCRDLDSRVVFRYIGGNEEWVKRE